MNERAGFPCWFEYTASDLDSAGSFYADLYGWDVADSGMDEMTYHLASIDGQPVAGLMSNDQMGDPPPPPNWGVYFAVADCSASVVNAVELGANVLVPVTEVLGTGHFAVLADPAGAVFGVMQQQLDAGAAAPPQVFAPDRVGYGAWTELLTNDADAALGFYCDLFGWDRSGQDAIGPDQTYHRFACHGADIGGVGPQGPSPMPYWNVYFRVSDIDTIVGKIHDSDASILVGPMDVPGGSRVVIATDPSGAVFAATAAS